MNTVEYLDAVKTRLGLTSDYALAKALHMNQPTIIGHRNGRTIFNDDTALKIADALKLNPLAVIAAANVERAKTPEMRARWMEIVEGFLSLLPHAKSVRRIALPR